MIQTLCLHDFRNYENAEIALSSGVNVFCGENAQGKTNILEAIALLSSTRLFRSSQKKDAIRFGCTQAEAAAQFVTEQRPMTIRMTIPMSGDRKSVV